MLKSRVRSASDIRHTTRLTFASDASVGDIVELDGFIARAMHNVDVSDDDQGVGAYEVDRLIVQKASGVAVSTGDVLYFDATEEEFTTTQLGNTKGAVALEAALSSETSIDVHLLGAPVFRTPDRTKTAEFIWTQDATEGGFYRVDDFIVRALHDVDYSADDQVEAAYEIDSTTVPKATGTAWSTGDPIYFDATDSDFTKTDTDHLAGVALAAAGSDATQGTIRLEGAPTHRHAKGVRLADAGSHFAAADGNVEDALQQLAKTIVITLPRFTGWTKDGSVQTVGLPNLELPVPVRVKRAYAHFGTEPDQATGTYVYLNEATLVEVEQDAADAEKEDRDIAIAANTDFAITITEATSGAGANCDIMLVAQLDDGE